MGRSAIALGGRRSAIALGGWRRRTIALGGWWSAIALDRWRTIALGGWRRTIALGGRSAVSIIRGSAIAVSGRRSFVGLCWGSRSSSGYSDQEGHEKRQAGDTKVRWQTLEGLTFINIILSLDSSYKNYIIANFENNSPGHHFESRYQSQ